MESCIRFMFYINYRLLHCLSSPARVKHFYINRSTGEWADTLKTHVHLLWKDEIKPTSQCKPEEKIWGNCEREEGRGGKVRMTACSQQTAVRGWEDKTSFFLSLCLFCFLRSIHWALSTVWVRLSCILSRGLWWNSQKLLRIDQISWKAEAIRWSCRVATGTRGAGYRNLLHHYSSSLTIIDSIQFSCIYKVLIHIKKSHDFQLLCLSLLQFMETGEAVNQSS